LPQGNQQDRVKEVCSHNPAAQWFYDNVSADLGVDGGIAGIIGGGVAANLSFKEISTEVGAGGLMAPVGEFFGAEAHVLANVQIFGSDVETGFFGQSQLCVGGSPLGTCVKVTMR
jgi:hypothetical protein